MIERSESMSGAGEAGANLNDLLAVTNGYTAHSWYYCIDDFTAPDGEWKNCPCCGLRPKVWQYDNGRSTACGCWESRYDHFSVYAESIMSVYTRTGGTNMTEYDSDDLRKNWNHWCETGEILFERAGQRDDGRW